MNSLIFIVKKLKSLLPYFIFIAIYFFFVSIEANKDANINKDTKKVLPEKVVKVKDKQLKIRIPVYPYEN